MPDDITVEVRDAGADGAVKIVSLTGSLEHTSISAINHVVLPLLEEGHVNLVFDCGGLKYVTSPALGILISYWKRAKASGGDTKFFGLESDIRDIFHIVGLDKTFEIHADEDAAVAAFGR